VLSASSVTLAKGRPVEHLDLLNIRRERDTGQMVDLPSHRASYCPLEEVAREVPLSCLDRGSDKQEQSDRCM
jgi:hypothetical protein